MQPGNKSHDAWGSSDLSVASLPLPKEVAMALKMCETAALFLVQHEFIFTSG